jgi:hypothetical protein
MSSRSIRVTVRGFFDHLSPAQQAELIAAQAEHDFLRTEYTEAGYLAYELPARPFFTFRFAEQAEQEKDIPAAAARAEAKAAAWMAVRGYPIKNLSSQTVDMSQVPLGKRGRREAARGD